MTTTLLAIPAPLAKTPGFPDREWEYLGCEDRRIPNNLCQYCGKQHVRYVHILKHQDWPDTIETGCVCAGQLGLEEEAINGERRAKQHKTRLKRFIETGWSTTKNRNPYKTYRNVRVAICGSGRYFKIAIDGSMGVKVFRSQQDAMTHAFNYIETITQ